MRGTILVGVLSVMLGWASAGASTFYVEPEKGTAEGDGSKGRPWKTLEEVVSKGGLKKVKGGDTVLLGEGFHGEVKFAGENESVVTIAAAEGKRPTLSRLTISSGKNWMVKGLVVSPSLGKEGYKGNIVSFGESGESSKITVEDCYIYTVEDASKWEVKEWMEANSGVNVGRKGKGLTLRNCFIRNTRFGVTLAAEEAVCEGNVISDFSADGIRATKDGQVVQYNVIKNSYVSGGDGDANHDDGIQCFLFNKGTGTVKGVKTVGNIIIAHEDAKQKWKGSLQGVGYFDGPLVDFVVTDNVVNVDAWHGIALYDAQNALVERNVVWTDPAEAGKARAWIMFGTKQKVAKDNVAKNNFATKFNLKQPGTVEEKNEICTAEIYEAGLKKAYKVICDKFGEKAGGWERLKRAGE